MNLLHSSVLILKLVSSEILGFFKCCEDSVYSFSITEFKAMQCNEMELEFVTTQGDEEALILWDLGFCFRPI